MLHHHIVLIIIQTGHFLSIKEEHFIALHEEVNTIEVSHFIIVGRCHLCEVVAEGYVGAWIAQIAQYGGHNVDLFCNSFVTACWHLSRRIEEDDGHTEGTYGSTVFWVARETRVVGSEHENRVLIPRHCARFGEKFAQRHVAIFHAAVKHRRSFIGKLALILLRHFEGGV